MNTLKNNVRLIGYLGNAPQIKTFANEKKIATMRIATSDSYFAQKEWIKETQWHNLVMWGKLAEKAGNVLKKGSHVLIEGKLTHKLYVDSKGGNQYFTEINVGSFMLLDQKQDTEEENPVSMVEEVSF